MPPTCSHHGYYKLVRQLQVRPSPSGNNRSSTRARVHRLFDQTTEKVKQVARIYPCQLVAAMGTTVWCRIGFSSVLDIEVKKAGLRARARTPPSITSTGPRRTWPFQWRLFLCKRVFSNFWDRSQGCISFSFWVMSSFVRENRVACHKSKATF